MTDTQDFRERLGQALRNLRIARGLNEAELAQRMGKRPSSGRQISRWELGRVAPGADQLFALLVALDMTFADLDRELNPAPETSSRLQAISSRLRALG